MRNKIYPELYINHDVKIKRPGVNSMCSNQLSRLSIGPGNVLSRSLPHKDREPDRFKTLYACDVPTLQTSKLT